MERSRINIPMKKIFTKVLVGIDGSNHSFRAADYAIKVAGNCAAELFAVTVADIPEENQVSQLEVIETDAGLDMMQDAKNRYETFTQRTKQSGIQLKTELLKSHSPVDYVLLEYAKGKEIDLIVIGTRGRTTLDKLLLGSVASHVITNSHCPVLLVK